MKNRKPMSDDSLFRIVSWIVSVFGMYNAQLIFFSPQIDLLIWPFAIIHFSQLFETVFRRTKMFKIFSFENIEW